MADQERIRRLRQSLRLISADDTDPAATHESEALRRQRLAVEALQTDSVMAEAQGRRDGWGADHG